MFLLTLCFSTEVVTLLCDSAVIRMAFISLDAYFGQGNICYPPGPSFLITLCFFWFIQPLRAFRRAGLYTRIHAYAYMHTRIHAYTHTRIHAYTHTRIHAYTHTRIHAYTHTHIHTYTHTHIHTYTHALFSRFHTPTRLVPAHAVATRSW